MNFAGVYPEKSSRQYPRWIAVWKGKVIIRHVTLPLTTEDSREDAESYAKENPPI